MTYLRRKQLAQASMVARTRSAIVNQWGQHYSVHHLARHIALHTEAELLQVPNIGKKMVKLIKAWLAIHHQELRHG
jgi:hypothetical protein